MIFFPPTLWKRNHRVIYVWMDLRKSSGLDLVQIRANFNCLQWELAHASSSSLKNYFPIYFSLLSTLQQMPTLISTCWPCLWSQLMSLPSVPQPFHSFAFSNNFSVCFMIFPVSFCISYETFCVQLFTTAGTVNDEKKEKRKELLTVCWTCT